MVMQIPSAQAGWHRAVLGDYSTLTKGLSYKSAFLSQDGPQLLGLGQFTPGGGAKLDHGRTYSGEYRDKDVARPGDVLIAMTDLTQRGDVLGSPLMVPQSVGDFCLFTLDAGKLKTRNGLDPLFLYYMLRNKDFRRFAAAHATGTTVRRVRPIDVLSYEVRLPPLCEQRAIAQALGTLDNKIELNRRMNATLEAMARALFKSWFVDFDPLRAIVEGRDPILPREIIDQFPNRFVNSEIGEIPEGWEVSEIGKEVQVVGGSTPSTKEPSFWHQGQHCWATPKDLSKLSSPVLLDTTRKITDAGLQKISSGMLPVGTVLLSSRAPIGYLAIAEVPTAVNQGFIAMRCEQRLPNSYVMHWCYRHLDYIRGIAGGSTFAEISKKAFRPVPVLVPSRAILEMYQCLAAPLYHRLVVNTKEALTLAALRDAILPKLISGEIRVPDVERALESVT